ncbi:DHBP synthase RibB-like alpha/beta domain-containing protein [Leucosporidium creatinivorum]|uniref:Threonylcarbamoyl-AMP synthase n=1 Tax=Leucosporidium creatinivorum TaxID=106004 RepID=A0A1Y2F9V6_9BASI|nr:DHBP synthase RibB-like alpha/beta domain-containing protein [Leucosporidium creatinivorum]
MRTALRLLQQLKSNIMSAPTPSIPSSAPASALLLPTSTPELRASSLATASSLLAESQLVAFPTETVYGLGASALSSSAVSSIYAAKGRPADNPLIVHVSSREMLLDLLPGRESSVPALYEPLIKRFWPGALTLIFPLEGEEKAQREVAPTVTAGLPSLAIRMPSHPLSLDLIRESNLPLAAPSANLSSRPSPTTAEHVRNDLGEGRGVAAILDGGECEVGLESTVVDFLKAEKEGEEGELRVLRAGGVSAEDLEDCLREAGFGAAKEGENAGRIKVYQRDFKSDSLAAKPTTPGMKYKHYSPSNARVVLVKPVPPPSPSAPNDDHFATPSIQDLIAFSTFASTSEPPYRVGLMLTSSTLASISPLSSEAITPSCNLITLPPTSTPPEDIPFPAPDVPTLLYSYELGAKERPAEAAQRLFAGLRYLDDLPREEDDEETKGVDLILVECVEETGVGLAVMERARKAAGGAGEMSFRL